MRWKLIAGLSLMLAVMASGCVPETKPRLFAFGKPVMFTIQEVQAEIDGQLSTEPVDVTVWLEGQGARVSWNVPSLNIKGKDMKIIVHQEIKLSGPETVITIPKGSVYDLKADSGPIIVPLN